MAIFTAIGAIATAVAGVFAAGGIGAFILQAAAGIGLNLLAQKIAGKKESQQDSGPGFSVQGRLNAGGDVPRSFMVGWGMTAGSLVYTNTWGPVGGTPNAYFVQVIALSDLPVQGLVAVWVSGEKCTLDDTPHADYGYPVLEYRKSGKDHLWIKFCDGTQTTADAYLVAKFGSDSVRPYQSTRVGVGCAYAICTALVNDELFSGFPTYKFEINGVRLYDPSRDSTVGGEGDQRWDEPATWGGDGDHLPAVQIYNLMKGISFESEWFYGLQGMTAPRLPASNWIARIEKCRDLVDGPDGEEPRYRAGGEISIANQLGDAVEELLTACQGKISEIGGFYKLHLGAPDSPVFSFTDDDIISTEEQSFTPFFGLADTINGITAKYPSPDEAWGMKPAPPVYRSDLEALAGNRRLLADVPLNFVPHHRQVQDLMQTALAEAQRARRHTLTLPPEFWLCEPGDIVEWTSARNGYVEKQFRLDGVLDKANLDVMVDLTEVNPADYDFDIETDYTPPTIGPSEVVRPVAQPIYDFNATAQNAVDDLGLSRLPGILLSWEGDVEDVAGVQFEARKVSGGAIVTRGRTDDWAVGSVLITQGLIPETNYEVRGRYIPGSPRETTWSAWLPVTTLAATFTIEQFSAALLDYIKNELDPLRNGVNFLIQRIAANASDQDAANFLDKVSVRQILDAQVGGVRTQITETAHIVQEAEQRLGAAWFLTINVDGYISGMYQYSNGQQADFAIIADKFFVATPAGQLPIFSIQEDEAVLNGTFWANKIKTNYLDVAALSAITANLGEVTTGRMRSPDGYVDFNLTEKYLLLDDGT